MKTFDDLFDISEEKDPEGYKRMMELKLEAEKRADEEQRVYREKAAHLLTFSTAPQITAYFRSLSAEQLMDHRNGLGITKHFLQERFNTLYSYDQEKGKKELLKLVMQRQTNDETKTQLSRLLLVADRHEMDDKLASLNAEQIADYTKILDNLYRKTDRAYHKNLNTNVFSVSKTSLKAYMNKTPWEEVKKALFELYPDQVHLESEYSRIYSEFRKMATVKNADQTVITITFDEDGRADVSGLHPGEIFSYALEFDLWQQWLGYYVSKQDIEKLGAPSFLAHCLWEMTFVGYDQEDIQDELAEALDAAQRIQDELDDEDDE